jgi:hypothetical protein
MNDYILLMHNDAPASSEEWGAYFAKLRQAEVFQGGRALGPGDQSASSQPSSWTNMLPASSR